MDKPRAHLVAVVYGLFKIRKKGLPSWFLRIFLSSATTGRQIPQAQPIDSMNHIECFNPLNSPGDVMFVLEKSTLREIDSRHLPTTGMDHVTFEGAKTFESVSL